MEMFYFILNATITGNNLGFTIVMIGLFLLLILLHKNYGCTKQEIQKLLKELKEIEDEGIDRVIKIENYKKIKAEVKAYNESLIDKNEKKHSTLESSDFFNNITLLEDKINYKFWINLPQLFPGIGILGTFMGLAFGLSSINTSGHTSEILSSIQPLLANISVAFITSIIGIFFSLITTVILNIYFGRIEELILRVAEKAKHVYPLYNKTFQGNELLEEIKEIKKTTNGLATDLSNQLGEHISSQVGEKIDVLITESNIVMKDLVNKIGGKVERLTETISEDFGNSLDTAMDKIFTEGLLDNFKQMGEDISKTSVANLENLNSFKEAMHIILSDLDEVKNNYKKINLLTSDTNEKVSSSLGGLVEHLENKTSKIHEILGKTTIKFETLSQNVENLGTTLAQGIEENTSNFDNVEKFTKTFNELLVNLLDIKTDFEEINKTTSNTNFELQKSWSEVVTSVDGIATNLVTVEEKYNELSKETETTCSNVTETLENLVNTTKIEVVNIDEALSGTSIVLKEASTYIKEVEIGLNKSLLETSKTMKNMNDYMSSNEKFAKSMNEFMSAEKEILNLWSSYETTFKSLNKSLVETTDSSKKTLLEYSEKYQENLSESLNGLSKKLEELTLAYKDILEDTSNKNTKQLKNMKEEFNKLMKDLNYNYVEITYENTKQLFGEYDEKLAGAINKFNGLINSLSSEIEELNEGVEEYNKLLKEDKNIK